MKRIRSPKNEQRRGAAMVEMAVVMPIFVTLVFGIIEFGQAFMVMQLINNAAREGGREAIVNGSSNTSVTQVIQDNLVATGVDPVDVTIAITVTEETGNPSAGNEVANANKRDLCTINVSIPFSAVSYITGSYLDSVPLRGQVAMRHE